MSEKCRRTLVIISVSLLGIFGTACVFYLHCFRHPGEPFVRAFEAEDRKTSPPKDGVLFIGSSSIARWKTLAEDFPSLQPLNRGVDGAQLSDLIYFADRVILAYRPRLVVIYAGDNDIYGGKTARIVFQDLQHLVRIIEEALPETQVAFISIKPSPARWNKIEEIQTANRLIRKYAQQKQRVSYIDVFNPMMEDDGRPRTDIFQEDGLHLNQAGYALWKAQLDIYRRML